MRKLYLLSLLVALLTFSGAAEAETKTPYKVDFNAPISTSAHDFKVGSGWGHMVDSYFSYEEYEEYYPTYTYLTTSGVDGTGCLRVGSQTSVGGYGDSGSTVDLLVTPAVTGEVSIAVKKSAYNGTVKFYTVTKEDGKYVKGDEIAVTLPELTTTDFATVTLPAQEGAFIGIWGSSVYMDDFSAASAEVELAKSLKINKVEVTSSISPNTTAEGKFPVSMNVTVTNNGEVDLTPGDADYSLSIVDYSTGNAYFTVPIDKALKIGENTTVSLSADIDYAANSSRKRYDAKENLTGTTSYGAWIEPKAYAPKLVIRGTGGKMSTGDNISFGRSNVDATQSVTIGNEGAAPLDITAIEVTGDFTSSLTAPITLQPDEKKTLDITMTSETKGVKEGSIVIKSKGQDDFTLNLAGTVLDPAKFYADFENNELPAGSISSDAWAIDTWPEADNKRVLSNSLVSLSKFILPLLEVSEGEKMTFDAGRKGSSSVINVYYSADRQNWTLAKEIKASDTPSQYVSSGSYKYRLGSFTLDNIPAGKYYIAFEAGYANIDNIYGFSRVAVDHDVMITKSTLPKQGMVNMEYKVAVTVSNINTKPETDCAAELYFDGKAVAKTEAVEIGASSTADLSMSYVPHETGTYKAFVKFVSGDFELTTDTVEVLVGEEMVSEDVQVGTANGFASDAPLSLFYKLSESETVYTAEQLGLKDGAKITGLTYYGYNTSGDVTTDVSVWMENTDATEYAEPYAETPKDGLTQMFDGEYTFLKAGEEASPVKMLQLNFSTPFVYTGKNLRIVVKSESKEYKRVYFQVNTDDQTHAIQRQNDNKLDGISYSAKPQPAVTLSVAAATASISGTVTDTYDVAIKDASVTLTSGDIIYKGTTDAEGRYSINVVQTDKTYAATYAAEGYDEKTTESVNFADGSLTDADVKLAAVAPKFTVGQPALVCLPLSITPDEAAEGKFYELKSYKDNVVTALLVREVEAGVPYLFIPASETPFTSLSEAADAPAAQSVTVDGLTFTGTYSAATLTADETRSFYGISGADDKTATLAAAVSVKPYGAYFTAETALTTLPTVEFTDNASGITTAGTAVGDVKADIYTIDGRKVAGASSTKQLKKGVYIIGGKKVIVR